MLDIWEKIADELLGTNATTITITGLDLAADKCYMLLFSTSNPQAAGCLYYLFFNNDLVLANYWTQTLYADGAAVNASRDNFPIFTYGTKNDVGAIATVFIYRDAAGYPRWNSQASYHQPNLILAALWAGIRTNTANVTRIDVSSSIANGMKSGTRLMLFKVRS